MVVNRVNINPDIIKGIINRAGKEVDESVRKDPSIEEWISGDKKPTLKQLETFANRFHAPFGYLFLDKLPKEEIPIPFFRKTKNGNHFDLNVYDTVSLIQRRQEWLREYLEENEFEQLSYVASFNGGNQNINEIVSAIHALLKLENDWAKHACDQQHAINLLVERMENIGMIICFNSIVGNSGKRKISVDECRGFALTDRYAPFIFVNNGDAKSAQVFTLIHEMAHILIGFSAGYGVEDISEIDDDNEKLCDRVAATFLVPEKLFIDDWKSEPKDYASIAKKYKVSPLVIARRAFDSGYITKNEFFYYYNNSCKTNAYNDSGKSGGNFYYTAIKRLSKAFAVHVNNALKSNQLLYRDAYTLTGLHGNTFNNLFKTQLG